MSATDDTTTIPSSPLAHLTWHKTLPTGAPHQISTDPSHLDHAFINAAFASSEMYWARPLPPAELTLLLTHSITLGLYTLPSPPAPRTQIGLARLITDHISTAYLTDVYVLPAHRGRGLFKWLMECVRAVLDAHPALRRVALVASPGPGEQAYRRLLDVWDVAEEKSDGVVMLTRRAFAREH